MWRKTKADKRRHEQGGNDVLSVKLILVANYFNKTHKREPASNTMVESKLISPY